MKKLSWKHLQRVTLLVCLAGGAIAILLSPLAEHNARAAIPDSFSKLARKARPSVVNISTVKVVKGRRLAPFPFESPFGQDDPFRDFFERFFGDRLPREFKQRSLGSGFVISKEGLILTNNHVVEKADKIQVRMSDEREFTAEVVGRDPKTDLALIRVDPDAPLNPLPLGDSAKLEVGDWVVAIGNPFGLGSTVTAGIVSAKYRRIGVGAYDDFIQTDASINPGNSGGPLFNTAGEVVGINTAIFSQSGGNIGIGFAIPINMAKDLLPQLKEGKVIRGWLGVTIQEITPELREKLELKSDRGVLVADVAESGPADKAGIKRGDVIVSFDGKEIREVRELSYVVASTPVGKTVTVGLLRDGKKKDLEVKVGELKAEQEQRATREEVPDLGMTVMEVTPELAKRYGLTESSGIVVAKVQPNTPAAEAGLQPGDIIVEIDQVPVTNIETYKRLIRGYEAGDTILLLVSRQGSTLYVTLDVGE